jgi:hypothetical protein
VSAKGLSLEQILAELEQYPHGIGEKYAGRLREEIERSYTKWQADRKPIPAVGAEGPEEEPEELLYWDKVDNKGRPASSYINTKLAITVPPGATRRPETARCVGRLVRRS